MSFRSVIGGLALTALVSGVAGCGDDKTNFSATSSSDNGQKIRVIGRVRNAQSFAPLVAQIDICGIATGYSDASGLFVIDIPKNFTDNTDGDFSTFISMRVSAAFMATQFFSQDFDNDETPQSNGSGEVDPNANSLSYMDIGTIELNTGFTQRVVVTKDGAPLAGAHVAVYADNEDYTTQYNGESTDYSDYSSCLETHTGTTTGDGVVDIANLDPFRRYNVVVPSQDLDGITGFDFPTEDESFTVQSSGAVYALDVDGTSFFSGNVRVTDDSDKQFAQISVSKGVLSTVTSSGTILLNSFNGNGTQATATAVNFSSGLSGRGNIDDSFGGRDYVTSADGSVTMVFQTPVTVVTGAAGREVSFRYFDNMADPANTATFNKLNVITGTVSSLPASQSTIWKFTPSSAMPAYTNYTIEFFAHSTASSSIAASIGRGYMRIPVGLSSTINVTADNYNGTTNGNGGSSTVFFDFDRIVKGSAQIIEFTNENNLNSFGPNGTFSIESRSNAIVNNITAATTTDIGDLGATAGLRFRSNSFQSAPDNRQGFANSMRVAFAVQDIDGNKLETILNLDVK